MTITCAWCGRPAVWESALIQLCQNCTDEYIAHGRYLADQRIHTEEQFAMHSIATRPDAAPYVPKSRSQGRFHARPNN